MEGTQTTMMIQERMFRSNPFLIWIECVYYLSLECDICSVQKSYSLVDNIYMSVSDTNTHTPVNKITAGGLATLLQNNSGTTCEQLLDVIQGGIRIIDKDFNTVFVNSAFLKMTDLSKDKVLGTKCYETLPGPHCHSSSCPLKRILNGENYIETEIVKHPFSNINIMFNLSAGPLISSDGNLIGIIEDFQDLTDIKIAEQNLDLRAIKLETQQALLIEKETALRQVMQQIETDKQRQKNTIHANINKIVVPLLRNARDKADDSLKDHLKIIENSLEDITSPLVDEMDQRYSSLTPREIEICNLIKQGLQSKEIANLFNTSEGTVEQQRKKIRRKLKLKDSGCNLTSFLRTK